MDSKNIDLIEVESTVNETMYNNNVTIKKKSWELWFPEAGESGDWVMWKGWSIDT
jgi:hypothetical protein